MTNDWFATMTIPQLTYAGTQTGISADVFTLPDGRELPELDPATEGDELYDWLMEIDRTMDNTRWGTYGDRHAEWYNAWSDEFRRIRRAMGIFDPYSQTW